jgi:hypothetical protein
MDSEVIKNSFGQLESELETAREAASQIEQDKLHGYSEGTAGSTYEFPDEALEHSLGNAYDTMALVLEAAGLTGTRAQLLKKRAEFENKGGLDAVEQITPDALISPALSYIDNMLASLRAVVGQGPSALEAFELAKLEHILDETNWLVQKEGVTPTSEKQVRDVMHKYLEAYFPSYTRKLVLPKPIKSFVPDGGIADLKVGIEFKFAASDDEVKTELGGIYEDMTGYSGSADWTRFYTVLYQTKAFESVRRFKKAISLGGHQWKAILVTGDGSRLPRKTRKANGKGAAKRK